MTLSVDLNGCAALIVGGYGALGSAIATAFARSGCHVVIAGRRLEHAESLAERLCSSGARASAAELDVRNVSEIRSVVAEVDARCNGIDFLINCLGAQREQRLLEVTEEAFDLVVGTQLKAAMFLAQSVASHQAERRRGRHIHLLSLRSILGYLERGYSSFASAKGGLAALVRQHAAELGPLGIRVNGIAPGIVSTAKNAAQTGDLATLQRWVQPIPLGRLALPEDVAQAALFLCSSGADYITGQTLYLDGGLTCCR
ncbi:SDR family oxidoreductase [Steroidobacter sp. S1-65]|uniref:SDR family oxidoreductase n=1 Tax=Steroidobacter gossypii TaxID=2805490 RepID=A0ABS1WYA4_9GAMM|nr:SDR family oxidoreductase [Steroidobacter gossypii]MBM0105959.1 SDR family oxidoreductase [Steroidobacter gossypii]